MILLLAGCAWKPDGALHIVVPNLDASGKGEATLIVGPDGTTVLVDAANDRHAVELDALLDEHRGARHVDDLLLTSYSAEHVGGIDDLLDPASENAVEVGRLVSRGPYDLDGDVDLDEYADLCDPLSSSGVPWLQLCTAEVLPACAGEAEPVPATACDGLHLGDLDDPADDPADASDTSGDAGSGDAGSGDGSFIDLGDGARLEFLYVDGFDLAGPIAGLADVDADTPGLTEGGRSLVVAVSWGGFRYLRGGDLGGNPADGWDLEFALADDGALAPVTLLQLDRHGSSQASNDTFLAATLDGGRADAIVSGGAAFVDSPDADVVARVTPRLGGGAIWATSVGEGGTGEGVSLCDQSGGVQDLVVDVTATGETTVACHTRGAR